MDRGLLLDVEAQLLSCNNPQHCPWAIKTHVQVYCEATYSTSHSTHAPMTSYFLTLYPVAPPRDRPELATRDSLRHSGPTQPPQRVWPPCNDLPLCSRLSSMGHADCKYGWGSLRFRR